MIAWERATIDTACGSCRKDVPRGEPIQALSSELWTGKRYRCPDCATGPAPADLPPLPVFEELVDRTPQMKMRHLRDGLPLDFKKRQTPREPGEEG